MIQHQATTSVLVKNPALGSEALKFTQSFARYLIGTADNEDLTRLTAHTLNLIPGSDVRADHIGWDKSPEIINGRRPDVTVRVGEERYTIEAEPSYGHNRTALQQVRDMSEDQDTSIVTNPGSVKPATNYYEKHGENFPVTTPFGMGTMVMEGLIEAQLLSATSMIFKSVSVVASFHAGVPPQTAYVFMLLSGVVGRQVAHRLYHRYLKPHVRTMLVYASMQASPVLTRAKKKQEQVTAKAKTVAIGGAKKTGKIASRVVTTVKNTAKRAWSAIKSLFGGRTNSSRGYTG